MAQALPDVRGTLGLQEARQALDQAFQRLTVEPILTAETVNDLHAALAFNPLVKRQLHVLHTS